MLRKSVFIFIFIVFVSISMSANCIHYGLTFNSLNVNKDSRTSLDLSEDRKLKLSPGFSLEFDLRLNHKILQSYGYVFRIITDETSSFDLVVNTAYKKINFISNGNGNTNYNAQFSSGKIEKDEWMKIKVRIDKNDMLCYVDNQYKRIPYPYRKVKSLKIFFGKNMHPQFHTSDVPYMTIKNLIIRNGKNEKVREYKMLRHGKAAVYDEVKGRKALVENGEWEIDKYTKWEKLKTVSLNKPNAQIAYDESGNRFFIATDDKILIYSIDSGTIRTIHVKGGKIFKSGGSQLIYDEKGRRLISYSIRHPDFTIFDEKNKRWTSDDAYEGLPPIQQHNRLIDTVSNKLIVFGGYGNYKYNAELAVHRLDKGGWQIKDLSAKIAPRYLSAMGNLGKNQLLVMGGFGSVSGRQEESPKNFYDLYSIDFEEFTCRKIAQFPVPQECFVFGNSMVINKDKNKFYALTYDNEKFHTGIQLMSFNWKTLERQVLGNRIGYNFMDEKSYCTLVYNRKDEKLYALILHQTEPNGYSVEIYSLLYPPLRGRDILQTDDRKRSKNRNYSIVFIGGFLLLILSAALIVLNRKRRSVPILSDNEKEEEKEWADVEEIKEKTVIHHPASCIKLLGGFQIFDSKGEDITQEFTPILRNLFLFILLNTINGDKKVTSEAINETFWLGMDKLNASNNRNVNIRKLRILSERIGGEFKIVSKNSYLYISLGSGVHCDYYEVMILLTRMKEEKTIDVHLLNDILNIASGGLLLPNVNAEEWLDDFKSEYSNSIIDVLTKASIQADIKENPKLLLKIINVILLHDDMDENSVKIKCRVLSKLGQKGSAKKCYDQFYSEYVKTLHTEPELKWEDIFKDRNN